MRTPTTARRRATTRVPVRTAAVIVALVVAVVGAGLWWALDRDDADRDCAGLRGDERVRTVLGAGWRADLPCGELADGLRRATTGERPGVHSLAQARAMRSVVLALADGKDHRVHPAVRVPLAEALADYAADTHAVLTGINDVYTAHDGADADAWQDGQGVHFAVHKDRLTVALRGLAEDPAAYAVLRAADLRQGAAGIAAVGPQPAQAAIIDALVRSAAPAGVFDGIADDVLRTRSESSGRGWQDDVLHRLTTPADGPVPDFTADPAGHLATTWLRGGTPADPDGRIRLHDQTAVLLARWTAAARTGLAPDALSGLQERARITTDRERREAAGALHT
ncbi:hypothetical protein ACWEQL_29315 [Kitasatospora sp. NPDC004240]